MKKMRIADCVQYVSGTCRRVSNSQEIIISHILTSMYVLLWLIGQPLSSVSSFHNLGSMQFPFLLLYCSLLLQFCFQILFSISALFLDSGFTCSYGVHHGGDLQVYEKYLMFPTYLIPQAKDILGILPTYQSLEASSLQLILFMESKNFVEKLVNPIQCNTVFNTSPCRVSKMVLGDQLSGVIVSYLLFRFLGRRYYAGVFLKASISFFITCVFTQGTKLIMHKVGVLRHSDAFTSSCMHSLMMCTLNLGDGLEIIHDESNIISLPSPPLLFTILEICHVFLDFLTTKHKSRAAYHKNCALEFGPIAFMSNGK